MSDANALLPSTNNSDSPPCEHDSEVPSLRADIAGLRAENERLREIIASFAAGNQVTGDVLQFVIKDRCLCRPFWRG